MSTTEKLKSCCRASSARSNCSCWRCLRLCVQLLQDRNTKGREHSGYSLLKDIIFLES